MAYNLARRILMRRRTGRFAHSEMSDSPFHVTVWHVLSPVNGSQSSNVPARNRRRRLGGYALPELAHVLPGRIRQFEADLTAEPGSRR